MNYFNCVAYFTDWIERSAGEVGYEHLLSRIHIRFLQILYLYNLYYIYGKSSWHDIGTHRPVEPQIAELILRLNAEIMYC